MNSFKKTPQFEKSLDSFSSEEQDSISKQLIKSIESGEFFTNSIALKPFQEKCCETEVFLRRNSGPLGLIYECKICKDMFLKKVN